jgi:adenylate cyclase
LSLAVPAAAALPAVLLNGIARLWLDQRNEKRLGFEKAALRRFQPAILADRVEAERGFLAEPVKQEAALLFVDLTRFTGLAERVGPERTQALLGEFHRIIDQEITRRAGLVLTYMGDGAMAVFGILPHGRMTLLTPSRPAVISPPRSLFGYGAFQRHRKRPECP